MKKMSWERAALVPALVLAASLAACGEALSSDDGMPAPSSAQAESQAMPATQQANPVADVGHDANMLGTGAATPPVAEDSPDVRLAADVKSTLVKDPDFTAMKIDVNSEDGVVTLRGRAPDPAARERATDIARTVRDVKSVDNQLTLG
jgi:osmotically-inducible protein OsmY